MRRSVPVLSRSEILVAQCKYGYEYSFEIKLEDGRVLYFKDYFNTGEKASAAGVGRSERMIEKGYEEGM